MNRHFTWIAPQHALRHGKNSAMCGAYLIGKQTHWVVLQNEAITCRRCNEAILKKLNPSPRKKRALVRKFQRNHLYTLAVSYPSDDLLSCLSDTFGSCEAKKILEELDL